MTKCLAESPRSSHVRQKKTDAEADNKRHAGFLVRQSIEIHRRRGTFWNNQNAVSIGRSHTTTSKQSPPVVFI